MTPVEVFSDDVHDPPIRFRTSVIYEMIVSLNTLLTPRRHTQWAETARQHLSDEFMAELRFLYEDLYIVWVEYLELAIDYPAHEDLDGFLNYVRNMSDLDFVFYIAGRRLSRKVLEETRLDPLNVIEAIRAEFGPYYNSHAGNVEHIPITYVLKDINGFRERLINLWQEYIDCYFREIAGTEILTSQWELGMQSSQHLLDSKGRNALFQHLLGKELKLPEPLPRGYPFKEIVMIPLSLMAHRAFMFYGYGNVTVIYSSEMTEERIAQINQRAEEAMAAVRALGDPTRLKILRLIAQREGRINGKRIAKILDMSPSTVSRQLGQLRDGNLIAEEPLDHRNIVYWLQRDTLTGIPDAILEYLYS